MAPPNPFKWCKPIATVVQDWRSYLSAQSQPSIDYGHTVIKQDHSIFSIRPPPHSNALAVVFKVAVPSDEMIGLILDWRSAL